MSLAMAIRHANPKSRLVGIDIRDDHRTIARDKNIFDEVHSTWVDESFDVTILAIPAAAAVRTMTMAAKVGSIVMDVCSIKRPLCREARALGISDRFAPSHPMAGLAAEGPAEAIADLFVNQSWILLENHEACQWVAPLITSLGANVVWLPNEDDHDEAMAAVSHGIHVTSLSAMLAYDEVQKASAVPIARVTGPGFRDITRLADSPSEFWVDTLCANGQAVSNQIQRIIEKLCNFQKAIDTRDTAGLKALLEEARIARTVWKSSREKNC